MSQNILLGLSYDDVLLIPQHSKLSSRSEVNLTTTIAPNLSLKLPLISINMSDVTEEKMATTLGKLGALGFIHRFLSIEEQADMVNKVKKEKVLVGAAIGVRNGHIKRAEALAKACADVITIDVAHGGMQKTIDATRNLKRLVGNKITVISGVVATYEAANDLFFAGADSVRVGVGPGTICTTRITTGVGVPQITAVTKSTRAAREHKKTILCDGGTKNSGDIVKGLAAGASAVVIGSQFAGTSETPGKIINIKSKKYKIYNASTSLPEKKNHVKNMKGLDSNYLKHVEGVKAYVPYKGSVSRVLSDMKAGIRSGFSYCGAKNIRELWKNAQFMRITPQGFRESGVHDIIQQ